MRPARWRRLAGDVLTCGNGHSPPPRPASHRRRLGARARRVGVGRRRTHRRSCSPTAASTSPAPTTCSRRCIADGRVAGRLLGPARPRRLRPRRALQLGGRPARRPRGARLDRTRPDPGARPLQGRRADAQRGRRAAPPGQPPRQPRRAAVRDASWPDVSEHDRTLLLAGELGCVARPPPSGRRRDRASRAPSTSWLDGGSA